MTSSVRSPVAQSRPVRSATRSQAEPPTRNQEPMSPVADRSAAQKCAALRQTSGSSNGRSSALRYLASVQRRSVILIASSLGAGLFGAAVSTIPSPSSTTLFWVANFSAPGLSYPSSLVGPRDLGGGPRWLDYSPIWHASWGSTSTSSRWIQGNLACLRQRHSRCCYGRL